jgi:3-oxoacyl-[acyl-carrier protein] reductase
MDLQLKGKRALVMGASSGIGRAIAASLTAEGVEVVINSRTESKLKEVATELGARGAIAADLSQPGEATRLTQEAIELLGGLEIIVTNTGGPKKGTFLEVTLEQWREDYQSLWLSVVEALHVALPEFISKGYGRVLMVTSIAAKEPLPGLTTSNGLRAGLAGLTRSIAREYASSGVTANVLLPGYTDTERLQQLNLADETVKQLVPAQRLGDPRELADLCAFLASERGGYITGQSFAVDGGVLRGH